ncbi:MAG TPA: tyrosine-type recombinase/integrase [Pseudaminobacter sp.]|nr:tyrosine-type recombinase/integrase [Pseudaminobacter sp.]
MASTRKRKYPNGTTFWQAVWHVTIDGERRQKTKAFDSASAAKAYAARMGDEAEQRGITDPNRFTVRGYFDYWLANHPKRAKLSPTTIIGYKRNLAFVSRHVGDVLLSKLTALDLDRTYAALLERGGRARDGSRAVRPLQARTVGHAHRAAFTALRQAVKWGLIATNPAANATPPTPRKSKARALVGDEWAKVWKAAKAARYPGMDVLVATLAVAGLRRSELLGLAFDSVDLDAGTIEIKRTVVTGDGNMPVLRTVTKTEGSERPITIPPPLVEMLKRHRTFITEQMLAFGKDYCRDPLFCFPEAGGHMMKPDTLTSKMRSLMRTAGVKGVQPTHGHRHSMATNALAAGVDIKTVSTRMGHSRTSTTIDMYVHTSDERDRAAADTITGAMNREQTGKKCAANVPQKPQTAAHRACSVPNRLDQIEPNCADYRCIFIGLGRS